MRSSMVSKMSLIRDAVTQATIIVAIVTSHNIIVVHNQLIRFPDIAFYVSPIPLHIAAMVILYGHMSRCERIPHQVALEDVWMALDMLPSFRWRWERKDLKPGHPLIAKLAEKVLDVNLHQVAPTGPPMLLSEQDWDSEITSSSILSPKPGAMHPPSQQPTTPKIGPAHGNHTPGPLYGPMPPGGSVALKSSPGGGPHNGDTKNGPPQMPEVPRYYFYPIYSENGAQMAGTNGQMPNMPFPFQSEHYMLEEKEPTVPTAQMQSHWTGVSGVRS